MNFKDLGSPERLDSAKKLGESYGVALRGVNNGYSELEGGLQSEVRLIRETLGNRERDLAVKIETLEDRYKECVGSNYRNEELVILQEKFRAHPHDFSVVKGIFYILLSGVLLLGDFAVLSDVLARLLHLKSRTAEGDFAEQFMKNPVIAYFQLPHLFWLTLSVLVIGFFLKLWLDELSQLREKERTVTSRIKFSVYSVFLICVLALIVAVAFARGNLDVGADVGKFGALVAVLLGIALPLVSAGFFARGYELSRSGLGLILAHKRVADRNRKREILFGELVEARSKLRGIQEQLEELRESSSISLVLGARKGMFSRGYQDGLGRLLSSPDGDSVFRKLRESAVARVFRGV